MIHEPFRIFTRHTIHFVGSVWAFIIATVAFISWIIVGFFMHFSHVWELTFVVTTTAVIFLSLFLIQHKHNRDAMAINIKLDELILASKSARNHVVNVENHSDAALRKQKRRVKKQAKDNPHS